MAIRRPWARWALVALAGVVAVVAYQQLGLGQWLTLEQLKTSRDTLNGLYDAYPAQTVLPKLPSAR
jgi:hypothetical protein